VSAVGSQRESSKESDGSHIDLSVILPSFNESAVITTSLNRLLAHLESDQGSFEILVVDDGSTDDTAALVQNLATADERIRLVRMNSNQGKGAALARGAADARGAVIAATDADLSYDLPGLDAVIAGVRSGAELACGNRSHPDSRINLPFRLIPYLTRRWAAGGIFRLAVQLIFGLKGIDTQCGLKAFSPTAARAIFPRLHTARFLADIEIFLIARSLKMKEVQVPVSLKYLSSASSVGMLADLPAALADLVRISAAALRGNFRPGR
jgi:dolichyl-phosphate beta-glucosyltransferase